jgi:hypothetical protein
VDLGEMLEDMQRRGVIKESSAILLWKNGEMRFCMDCGKLNDVIMKDCFPLSQIDSTLDILAGAKWFSTLDLKSSYWQVICIRMTRRLCF